MPEQNILNLTWINISPLIEHYNSMNKRYLEINVLEIMFALIKGIV